MGELVNTQYLTPGELTERYHGAISQRTLANWRSKGQGPKFVKIGGKVLYALAAVLEWEATRVRDTARKVAQTIAAWLAGAELAALL